MHKNWEKHKVTPVESEQIFFNKTLLVAYDVKHSKSELRYYALGVTDTNRYLFIAFTIRNNLIRVISSRDMSKKERKTYERQNIKKQSRV
ncbi:MAG: BrnT family toxin [candidate division KSB1 bacterium]|nr:BrnT family toxin [candidate division KSB1 bacterium]